ncbi:hypothetical protein YC2023_026164 [Brassica napus]
MNRWPCMGTPDTYVVSYYSGVPVSDNDSRLYVGEDELKPVLQERQMEMDFNDFEDDSEGEESLTRMRRKALWNHTLEQ